VSFAVDADSQNYSGSVAAQSVLQAASASSHRRGMSPAERRPSATGPQPSTGTTVAQHRNASVERNPSPVDQQRPAPRPSPTRGSSLSAGQATSPNALKQTYVGGYARRVPLPTDGPTATVAGTGRKARRADSSPHRGTVVPTLSPQDVPTASFQKYHAAIAREGKQTSTVGSASYASTTPRQQAPKNVSFGGSQFYSPPQNYNS
jgi:hypothetical protein